MEDTDTKVKTGSPVRRLLHMRHNGHFWRLVTVELIRSWYIGDIIWGLGLTGDLAVLEVKVIKNDSDLAWEMDGSGDIFEDEEKALILVWVSFSVEG